MTERTKHPDCEDRCQLYEHKGYISCHLTGECAYADAHKATANPYDPNPNAPKEYPGE